MKTDSIFFRLFQEFPSIFFELIGEPPEEADLYQFSSVEVKQTAFRIDGVFLPTQTEENPVYFVEVQFQPDSEIYSRLFAEICLYLRQNKPENDWRAVVVYPTQSTDTGDIKHYREFFSSQRVSRIYLDELGEATSLPIGIASVKLVIEAEDTAIGQARELIDRVTQDVDDEIMQGQLLQLIETILVYKFPRMSREEIEAMFSLTEGKQTRFYQDAFAEGKLEGREEGREEGKREATLNAVRQFLALGLSLEQIAQGLSLNVEEVRQMAQQQSSNE
ncbi:Rpn family recombination-promoting nuclease/putative transposase [Hassallia byssoidea VB512170]|uniref:Rpn family recombination-promoting nuclease/putative transposase n=1 Tax=Hassallia byssoidea VB512170 TaxID=1304833 RepID=A0A846H679_9CYAN|nr:Rpn family recombination-promoting nuclease/putative transposase [Hassalia byssoidea VB512170]